MIRLYLNREYQKRKKWTTHKKEHKIYLMVPKIKAIVKVYLESLNHIVEQSKFTSIHL